MGNTDKQIVLTLDAGGTNFVFSAIQDFQEITQPLSLPAIPNDIEACLNSIAKGFDIIKSQLPYSPVAISFAFPGPADYKNGIIGDLPNFPAFRGGVALGAFLENKFGIPVFINNDGNLFAYGEALYGALPMINKWLKDAPNPKQYQNLLGITLGTGFGSGVVINKTLLTGDNGSAGDLWCWKNPKYPEWIIEESVSIRAVKRVYAELSGNKSDLSPKEIFEIAERTKEGDCNAAIKSFEELGTLTAEIIAGALTLIDGLLVIGGGLSGAAKYIVPGILNTLRQNTKMANGAIFPRMQNEIFDLNNPIEKEAFLKPNCKQVKIIQSDGYANYDIAKRTGIIISPIGTNRAVMCGAYAFAIQQLESRRSI